MAFFNLEIIVPNGKDYIAISSDKNKTATIPIRESNVKTTLVSLEYNKKVYHPCEIKAVLQMDYTPNVTTPQALKDTLVNAKVKLTRTDDGTDSKVYAIAQNYYVHKIVPKFSGNISVYVTLYIFSIDNKLTLNKFCKAYTAKKLVLNILLGLEPGKEDSKDAHGSGDIVTLIQNAGVELANTKDNIGELLRVLAYDKEKKGKQWKEFMQPYLVQYNESFYSFLARTANRCGEFLSFEDGKLCVGLPSERTPLQGKEITNYASIAYTGEEDINIVKVENISHSGTHTYSTPYQNTLSYDFETPQDDYFTTYERDQWTTFLKEYIVNWSNRILGVFALALNSPTLADMCKTMAEQETAAYTKAKRRAKTTNETDNKEYIDSALPDQKISSDKVTGFHSAYEEGKLLTALYSATKINEERVEREKIEIDFDNIYEDLKLGEKISVMGDNYIVTEISGRAIEGKESFHIVAIPIINDVITPPLYDGGHIRKAPAQVAIIAKSGDEEKMHRVRIRYPWQKESDDPSPWIRITTPAASNNGGFHFQPTEGVEVLVDYAEGNIERPYVVGLLYTRDSQAPRRKLSSQVITSLKGHYIAFYDGKGREAAESYSGILPWLASVMPSANKILESDLMKDITGGITISDKHGLYTIDMSAAKRNISIKSPFGDVAINAFTGITISAPNGNISIRGKNVSIVAGNRLELVSGKNIPNAVTDMDAPMEEKKNKKSFVEGRRDWDANNYGWKKSSGFILGLAAGFVAGKIVDIKLIRTIVEAYLKPKSGTLSIKSNRYLTLSAGKGKVELPNRAYTKRGINNGNAAKLISQYKGLKNIPTAVDLWKENCVEKYKAVNVACDALKEIVVNSSNVESAPDEKAKEAIIVVLDKVRGGDTKPYDKVDSLPWTYLPQITVTLQKACFAANDLITKMDEFVKTATKPDIDKSNFYAPDIDMAKVIKNDKTLTIPFFKERLEKGKTFDEDVDNFDFTKDMTFIKRKLAMSFLAQKGICENKEKLSDADITDDEKWMAFAEKYKESTGAFVDTALGLIKGRVPYQWVTAHGVWGTTANGEILISDKSGKTLNFENGHLNYSENTDKRLDRIIDTLKEL